MEGEPYVEFRKSLMVIKSSYHSSKRNLLGGLIKHEDFHQNYNRNIYAIIDMLEDLPDTFFKFPKSELERLKNFIGEETYSSDSGIDLKREAPPLKSSKPEIRNPTAGHFEFDFFFCHSSHDHDEAMAMVNTLKRDGFSVFFSTDTLRSSIGKNFVERINEALEKSRHFIWHCTPNSSKSPWVKQEYTAFYGTHFMTDQDNRRFFILKGTGFQLDFIPTLIRSSIQCADNISLIISNINPPSTTPVKENTAPPPKVSESEKESYFSISNDRHCWQLAEKADTVFAYKNYLKRFPKGEFAKDAEAAIRRLTSATFSDEKTPTLDIKSILKSDDGIEIILIGDKYGFRNAVGTILAKPIYDKIYATSENVWIGLKNMKWGLLDYYGKEITPFKYDQVWDFSDGLAVFEINNTFGFLTTDGAEFSDKFDYASSFSEGIAVVGLNDKFGYLDSTGRLVTALKYDKAAPFSEGLAAVTYRGKVGFIDKNGTIKIKPTFEDAESFNEGLAVVTLDGMKGYVNTSGELIIPAIFSNALSFKEGLAVVVNEGVGYINKAGDIIIPCEYEEARSFSQGLACVKQGELYGYIDKNGKVEIPFQFDDAGSFNLAGVAAVRKGKRKYWIDKDGIPLEDSESVTLPVLKIFQANNPKEHKSLTIFKKKSKR